MRRQKVRKAFTQDDTRGALWTRLGDYLTIPILLAVSPIIGFLFGAWLDRRLNTVPWLTVVFLVLGFVAGGREVWQLVQRSERKKR